MIQLSTLSCSSTLIFGHLAQLEEHPLDVRKVMGSSPLVSTNKRPAKIGRVFFLRSNLYGNFYFPIKYRIHTHKEKQLK